MKTLTLAADMHECHVVLMVNTMTFIIDGCNNVRIDRKECKQNEVPTALGIELELRLTCVATKQVMKNAYGMNCAPKLDLI